MTGTRAHEKPSYCPFSPCFIPASSYRPTLHPDRYEASISDWFTLFISGLLLLLRSTRSPSSSPSSTTPPLSPSTLLPFTISPPPFNSFLRHQKLPARSRSFNHDGSFSSSSNLRSPLLQISTPSLLHSCRRRTSTSSPSFPTRSRRQASRISATIVLHHFISSDLLYGAFISSNPHREALQLRHLQDPQTSVGISSSPHREALQLIFTSDSPSSYLLPASFGATVGDPFKPPPSSSVQHRRKPASSAGKREEEQTRKEDPRPGSKSADPRPLPSNHGVTRVHLNQELTWFN